MERILAYFGSYKFIFSLCTVAAALVCWLLLRHLIHRFTEKITSTGALSGRRQTYLALTLNFARGLLALLALILVLQIHGVNVSSLVAGLGIIGAIVGLALQDMLKDVIMGMNILTGEYFAVGDVVKYGEVTGEVVLDYRGGAMRICRDEAVAVALMEPIDRTIREFALAQ